MPKKTFKNIKRLIDLPNVGKAVESDLNLLCIHAPEDLKGKNAFTLYDKLCRLMGKRQDPCVIDVFISAISFVNGGRALPWWHFTEERKTILSRKNKENKLLKN
jgi:hypothetical protein